MRTAVLLHAIEHLLELDLHDGDGVAALGDAGLELLAAEVVVSLAALLVELGELVAQLLLSLHHGLQLDKYGRRHVEEVVLSVQLLVLVPQFSAPFTELIYSLLHLVPLVFLEALRG